MIETVAEVPGNLRTFALDAVRGDSRPSGGASVTVAPEPAVQADQVGANVSVEPPPTTSGDSAAEAPPASAGRATPPEAGPPVAQTLARANPPGPSGTVVQPSPATPGPAEPEQQIGAGGGAGPATLPEAGRPEAGASQTAGVNVSPQPGSPPADAVLPALGPPLYDHPRAKASEPANGASGAVDVSSQAAQSGGSGTNPPDAKQVLARLVPPAASGGTAAPQVFEAENTDARVILRAHDTSWIRVDSASGDYLRSHTLQPGDVFLVPNRSDLALWTGNAGGLDVIVDGTTLPPLGGDGSVLRDVSLDPERLRARLVPEKTRKRQGPFVLDLGEAAQEELAEAAGLLDLAEDRLDDLLAQAIAAAKPGRRGGELAAPWPLGPRRVAAGGRGVAGRWRCRRGDRAHGGRRDWPPSSSRRRRRVLGARPVMAWTTSSSGVS